MRRGVGLLHRRRVTGLVFNHNMKKKAFFLLCTNNTSELNRKRGRFNASAYHQPYSSSQNKETRFINLHNLLWTGLENGSQCQKGLPSAL